MKNLMVGLLCLSTFACFQISTFAQNVGIGTTTPAGKLHIKGSVDTSQLIIDANFAQSNTNPIIKLRNSAGTDLMWIHSNDPSNSFVGLNTGRAMGPSGGYNTLMGKDAGYSINNGSYNTALGNSPLYSNTTANKNTAIGKDALYTQSYSNSDSPWDADNVAVGYQALYNNQPTSTSSGIQNTSVGNNALSFNTTGSKNTALGYNADVSLNNLTNATALGYNAKVAASNALILGGTGAEAVKVGIGISSPKYNLHIHNSSVQPVMQFTSTATGSTSGDGFLVGLNTTAGEVLLWNFETEAIEFGTSGNQRMRIKADGKIGIGTAFPNFDLQIHNDTTQSVLQFTSASTDNGPFDGFVIGNSTSAGEAVIFNQENQDLLFGTNYAERMRIKADGKVGIGTNTPGYTLEVSGAIARTGNFVNTATSVDYYGVSGICNNTPNWGYGVYGEGGYIGVRGAATLTGSGNRYGVYGSATGGSGDNWAIYSAGSSYATGTWQSSDAMFKKDVRAIENALEILSQLEPLSYKFNTEAYSYMGLPAEPQYGFIAQDMEKILPELVRNIEQPIDDAVNEKHTIQFKGINYTELIPLTIAALQEQQNTIEALQSQVRQLLSRIETLEKN